MVHAAFELICVLCQSVAQPAASTVMLLDAALLVDQRVLIVQASFRPQVFGTAAVSAPSTAAVAGKSLGEQWLLPGGRELRLNLTPTPDRCAPLVELTF